MPYPMVLSICNVCVTTKVALKQKLLTSCSRISSNQKVVFAPISPHKTDNTTRKGIEKLSLNSFFSCVPFYLGSLEPWKDVPWNPQINLPKKDRRLHFLILIITMLFSSPLVHLLMLLYKHAPFLIEILNPLWKKICCIQGFDKHLHGWSHHRRWRTLRDSQETP